jgi:hypothetical protein
MKENDGADEIPAARRLLFTTLCVPSWRLLE